MHDKLSTADSTGEINAVDAAVAIVDTTNRCVFVYGTLRRGECNDINLRVPSPVFVDFGQIEGALYRLDWYPGLVLRGSGKVTGEIYQIDASLETVLDEIENLLPIPTGEYQKRDVIVELPEGPLICFVYEIAEAWLPANADLIESGDWCLFQNSRSAR